MQSILKIEEKDIKKVNGLFVVEIDNNDYSDSIIKNKKIDSFWIEKRISHIVSINDKWILAGFYYPHSKELSVQDFVKKINSEFSSRHYRLLSNKEINLVFKTLRKNKGI